MTVDDFDEKIRLLLLDDACSSSRISNQTWPSGWYDEQNGKKVRRQEVPSFTPLSTFIQRNCGGKISSKKMFLNVFVNWLSYERL